MCFAELIALFDSDALQGMERSVQSRTAFDNLMCLVLNAARFCVDVLSCTATWIFTLRQVQHVREHTARWRIPLFDGASGTTAPPVRFQGCRWLDGGHPKLRHPHYLRQQLHWQQ